MNVPLNMQVLTIDLVTSEPCGACESQQICDGSKQMNFIQVIILSSRNRALLLSINGVF